MKITTTAVEEVKQCLASVGGRIRLYELMNELVEESIGALTRGNEDAGIEVTPESLDEHIRACEKAVGKLCAAQTLVGFWGLPDHRMSLTYAMRHLGFEGSKGSRAERVLSWYPVVLLLYTGGVSAIAANNYENLKEALHVTIPGHDGRRRKLVRAYGEWSKHAYDLFKLLPGRERNHVPMSEHLFINAKGFLDNLSLHDDEYEEAFDRFEVLLSLEHAEQYARESEHNRHWAPTGRFRWKLMHGAERSPYHRVLSEADGSKQNWRPIEHGMFQGSYERFLDVAKGFGEFLNGIR